MGTDPPLEVAAAAHERKGLQLQKVVPPIVLQVAVRPELSLMKVVLPIRLTVADDPS